MATYYLQKVANLKNVKGDRYKPHFDDFETKTIRDMAEFLEAHNYCTKGEVLSAMSHITKYLADQLRLGNKVRWEGIGEFEPSLDITGFHELTHQKGEAGIRVEGLHIDKVKFHPDKELLQEANKDFSVRRSQHTATVIPNERTFTPEQRHDMLSSHLAENQSITIKEYAALTALPRTAASQELHAMAASSNGLLTIEGSGSHIRFVKNKK